MGIEKHKKVQKSTKGTKQLKNVHEFVKRYKSVQKHTKT